MNKFTRNPFLSWMPASIILVLFSACSTNKELSDYRCNLSGRVFDIYANGESLYYNQSWDDMSILFLVKKGNNELLIKSVKNDIYRPMDGAFELYSTTNFADASTKRGIKSIEKLTSNTGDSIKIDFQVSGDVKGRLLDELDPLTGQNIDDSEIRSLLRDFGASLKTQDSFVAFAKNNIVYCNAFGEIKDIDYVKRNIFKTYRTSVMADEVLPEGMALKKGEKLILVSNANIGKPVFALTLSGKTIFSLTYFYYCKQNGAGKMLLFFNDDNP